MEHTFFLAHILFPLCGIMRATPFTPFTGGGLLIFENSFITGLGRTVISKKQYWKLVLPMFDFGYYGAILRN